MPATLHPELRGQLVEAGFKIVTEGQQEVPRPHKRLVMTMADCIAKGAKVYGIRRKLKVKIGSWEKRQVEIFDAGNDIFAVFDTVVSYLGHTGHLSFIFTYFMEGQLNISEESVGVGLFTEEDRAKAATLTNEDLLKSTPR